MCFAPQRRATFHLSSPQMSPRRFSEPTFQPSGATKPQKNTVFRDFPTFSRTCIFFLLIFSLLTLLPADCFFISPYCRKFDFQTSFDHVFYHVLWRFIYDQPLPQTNTLAQTAPETAPESAVQTASQGVAAAGGLGHAGILYCIPCKYYIYILLYCSIHISYMHIYIHISYIYTYHIYIHISYIYIYTFIIYIYIYISYIYTYHIYMSVGYWFGLIRCISIFISLSFSIYVLFGPLEMPQMLNLISHVSSLDR